MEWIREIDFKEVLEKCMSFVEGNLSQEELTEWGNKIRVRLFIPMSEKVDIINKLIYENYYSDNLILKSSELEMNKFWYLFLAYTNIKIEEDDKEYLIEDAYNVIFPCLYGWLYNSLKSDYKVAESLLNNCLNYLNLLVITSSLNEIDNKTVEDLKEIDTNILDLLKDKEKLKDVISLLNLNVTKEDKLIKKEIQKTILNNIKNEE